MPRFSILIHDHPFPHWDLLLENGSSCLAWRLLDAPDSTENPIRAEKLIDHRTIYLDYEGPVSGDRGCVVRWDSGTFEWHLHGPDVCEVQFAGMRFQGRIRLEQIHDPCWSVVRLNSP